MWADKAMRRADLDEVESMLLSSWNDSKQVYRIGKELWDELRIDEADEVPVDAAFALRGEIEDIAVAGFTAALKEGSVHLSAVPVSGDEDAPGMVMLEKVVRD